MKLGHGSGAEDSAGLLDEPASGLLGLLAPRAIGGDTCSGVHLAIELGEHEEGDTRLAVGNAGGALPDGYVAVELVPDLLRAVADLF